MQTHRWKQSARPLMALMVAAVALTLAACGARSSGHHHSSGANRLDLAEQQAPTVLTGLDVLERDNFEILKGRRIGLIGNHSSLNRKGEHLLDLLWEREGIEIVALFSPEHGFRGTSDERVADGVDEQTGLPIFSLYGATRVPTDESLEGIDTLVFDIQDIGARFYTYISTMGECMRKAEEHGIDFIVLDRPNPIQGNWYDGAIQDDDLVGRFTSFVKMPMTHGMTVGEIARLYHAHHDIRPDLIVVPMEGWTRDMYWDQTGLPWVNPSPNMRSMDQMLLYTVVAQTEGNRDVSVGRGTERPFEYLGAPWFDADAFVENMRARDLPGIWIMRQDFIPREIDVSGLRTPRYQFTDEVNHGARFVVNDRDRISPVVIGLHMLDAMLEIHPERYSVDQLRGLLGAQWVLDALKERQDPDEIIRRWREDPEFKAFAERRASVLIY